MVDAFHGALDFPCVAAVLHTSLMGRFVELQKRSALGGAPDGPA